ncbi:uncharacterized protein [Dysidea avara]|uniref:uncharacterized protein n=1 Tax=Dysidea avara TaxID=196820 RepID=UPI00331D6B97
MPPKNAQDTRRDNFSAQVVKILAERSGGKCAICRAPTWGPNDCAFKATNIGQAAHITAAAPNGPRYDPTMKPEKRRSALNGMWLCGNCHQKIDKNVGEYPVKRLQDLKKQAEDDAKKELGVAAAKPKSFSDDSPITIATSASAIMEIRKAKSMLQDSIQTRDTNSQAEDFLEEIKYISVADHDYLPAVGTELLQYYWLLVNYDSKQTTWLQIVRLLKEVADAYHTTMTQDDVDTMCTIVMYMITNKTKDGNMTYQSATVFLTNLARQLKNRKDITNTAQDELNTVKANTGPKRGTRTRHGGKDTIDGGDDSGDDSDGDEAYKYPAVDESHDSNEWVYLSAMCDLVELGDEERRQKEVSLENEGYITYVI